MRVRLTLSAAAVALAFGALAGCSSTREMAAGESASTQVRPAQMTALNECERLAQRVEKKMPTAKVYRVPFARNDLEEARELCRSGQEEEGIGMLHGVLGSMDQEP